MRASHTSLLLGAAMPALLLSGAALLAPATAAAQAAASNAVEEVVITARNRTERLQDAPIAVTAFSEAAIERQAIRTIDDVAHLTPGLIFDKGFIPQDTRPQLRGLPATRGRPPIGILIDGVDVSSEAFSTAGGGNLVNLRLLDVERIEVVKGPQSALYGRVAFGGAINYVTKTPSKTFAAEISASAAQYGEYEVRGSITGPVNDILSLRLNAAASRADGFYRNTVSGERIGGYENQGASLAARLTPTDKFTIDASVLYSTETDEPQPKYYYGSADASSTRIPLPANIVGRALGTTVAPATVSVPAFGGFNPRDAVRISLNPRTLKDYIGSELDLTMVKLRATYDLGFAQLSSSSSVLDADALSLQDLDNYGARPVAVALPAPGGIGEPLPRFWESDLRTSTRQYNQEIRLADLSGGPFRWGVGALYWREELKQTAGSALTNLSTPTASAGLNTVLTGNPQRRVPQSRTTDHRSIYALAEYDITPRLVIGAEARQSYEKFVYGFTPSITIAGTGLTPVLSTVIGLPNGARSKSSFFTPKAFARFKATDDIMVYASAAKGIKPGGYSSVGFTANPDLVKINPEELISYELGAKTTFFGGRVRLNGAVFHMDYDGKAVQTLVPDLTNPTGYSTSIVNASAAKIDGVEADVAWRATDALTLTGSYTWVNSRYEEFKNLTTDPVAIAQAGQCVITVVSGRTLCQVDYSGKRLERIPRHNFNAGATYTQPIRDGLNLIAELTTIYQSSRFVDEANTIRLDGYFTADARIGLEADKWEVFAFVNNLSDDDTIKSANTYTDTFIAPVSGLAMGANAPDRRQIGVRAVFRR